MNNVLTLFWSEHDDSAKSKQHFIIKCIFFKYKSIKKQFKISDLCTLPCHGKVLLCRRKGETKFDYLNYFYRANARALYGDKIENNDPKPNVRNSFKPMQHYRIFSSGYSQKWAALRLAQGPYPWGPHSVKVGRFAITDTRRNFRGLISGKYQKSFCAIRKQIRMWYIV